MKYLIIALIWSVYCVIHSFLISIRFTNFISGLLKKYYAFYRLFYILISLLLLIPLINYTAEQDNNIILFYSPAFDIVRRALTWGSLAMFFWAFFLNYDSLSFFGIRQILNLNNSNKNESNEISRKGLLAIMRHPMYFALIIFLWSNTFKISDIVVNIVLTIYIIIGTILEEKKLVLEYGESYLKYKRDVPMLIPFLKK